MRSMLTRTNIGSNTKKTLLTILSNFDRCPLLIKTAKAKLLPKAATFRSIMLALWKNEYLPKSAGAIIFANTKRDNNVNAEVMTLTLDNRTSI